MHTVVNLDRFAIPTFTVVCLSLFLFSLSLPPFFFGRSLFSPFYPINQQDHQPPNPNTYITMADAEDVETFGT